MDLTKKIELYFGQSKVCGETVELQECLDRETEFCAIYVNNEVPADVHNKTTERMLKQFGVDSKFAEERNSYVRPYLVRTDSGLASVGIPNPTAQNLKGSGFKVGGMFFNTNIADQVLMEFDRLGYEIDKKYD